MRALRQFLGKQTTTQVDWSKGLAYKVPGKGLQQMLHWRDQEGLWRSGLEHMQGVERGDPKNWIAFHAHVSNHAIYWD